MSWRKMVKKEYQHMLMVLVPLRVQVVLDILEELIGPPQPHEYGRAEAFMEWFWKAEEEGLVTRLEGSQLGGALHREGLI